MSFSSKMSVHFLILPSGKQQPGGSVPGPPSTSGGCRQSLRQDPVPRRACDGAPSPGFQTTDQKGTDKASARPVNELKTPACAAPTGVQDASDTPGYLTQSGQAPSSRKDHRLLTEPQTLHATASRGTGGSVRRPWGAVRPPARLSAITQSRGASLPPAPS